MEEGSVTRGVVLGPLIFDIGCEGPGFCCGSDDGRKEWGRGTREDCHDIEGRSVGGRVAKGGREVRGRDEEVRFGYCDGLGFVRPEGCNDR